MEFHEAANIFPLDEDTISPLSDDIKKNGQQVPIEICDGKIIDGRRRFLACKKAKVDPITREVSPSDPIAYVLSLNLHRRHLTPSQCSMVGARARDWYDEQAKERQKEATIKGNKTRAGKDAPVVVNLPPLGKARDEVGKSVGVSGSLIDYATKVIEKGEPEIVKAVDEGRLSVSSAAEIVDEPPEVQKEIAEKAKFSGGRYRKPKIDKDEPEQEKTGGKILGVGVIYANEAINSLKQIPKNDQLRKRGFQIVTDWIKHNQ